MVIVSAVTPGTQRAYKKLTRRTRIKAERKLRRSVDLGLVSRSSPFHGSD